MTETKRIYNELGSLGSQKYAMKWFINARNDENNFNVTRLPEQHGFLHLGKIHVFSYNPKHKDKLDFYDKKPCVLSIGRIKHKNNKEYDLGLNLNFIPEPYKWYILDTVIRMYQGFFDIQNTGKNSENSLLQSKIKYKYIVLKNLLKRYGFEFAIRQYIPERKSRVYVISYNKWVEMSLLSIENFEGITWTEMYKKFMESK